MSPLRSLVDTATPTTDTALSMRDRGPQISRTVASGDVSEDKTYIPRRISRISSAMVNWFHWLLATFKAMASHVFGSLLQQARSIFGPAASNSATTSTPTSTTTHKIMTRTMLLRLLPEGEPFDQKNANDVLSLPAVPAPEKGPLFDVIFTVEAGAPVSYKATLHINVPKPGKNFDRNAFQSIPIGNSLIVTDVRVPVSVYAPGAYCWYITYNGDKETKRYYFNVPPSLFIDGKYLPFNDINIQTVVLKWIGGKKTERWPEIFNYVSKAKGYNMIHFTPLQYRGELDLPYLIYDQLEFDPNIFDSNEQAINFIRQTMKSNHLLSLTDVVLNHTANNSSWLVEHPESGYNQVTAPHLRAAIALEEALMNFDIESLGLPLELNSYEDVSNLIDGLNEQVIVPLKLWEFYVFDVDATEKAVAAASEIPPSGVPSDIKGQPEALAKFVLENATLSGKMIMAGRFANKFDAGKLRGIITSIYGPLNDNELKEATKEVVNIVNVEPYKMFDSDHAEILKQLKDRTRYLRVDGNGPKLGSISNKLKVIEPYFTVVKANDGKSYYLANNGWIWGGNPLVDFALDQLRAYLRREVIVWGDCVKLRYGTGPEDSPYLWKRMTKYVQILARVFDGFRIDNCHLTPLHVGEALLDAARAVNPNLYVVAELFSGSEAMDKIFVERLAINTLIREAMQAHLAQELSRLVHKHGGKPIGSLAWLPLDDFVYPANKEPSPLMIESYSRVGVIPPIVSLPPHALFMDCTHDNETPTQRRTPEDTLLNAALVAFCSLAIGSVLGYDEVYPHLLDVVGEHREYALLGNGIAVVKQQLHAIRHQLVEELEDISRDHEMYIHHEGQYITIQRHNALTGKGWFLIARTKFEQNPPPQTLLVCKLAGTTATCKFAYVLECHPPAPKSDTEIFGIPSKVRDIIEPQVNQTDEGAEILTSNDNFPPGAIAVFSTEISGVSKELDEYIRKDALEASKDLLLFDLNNVLFKCENEEREALKGSDGVYVIPGVGPLVYAGLEGWNLAMRQVVWNNDLGLPLCDHLRAGTWACDFIVGRLNKFNSSPGVAKLQQWLHDRMEKIKTVPFSLRPRYFCLVVGIAYELARFRALRLMSLTCVAEATNFVQRLAMTSVQMMGALPETSLVVKENVPCMAAGLPHFASGFMRCWGRDVFIAFPGLLLVTGRFKDAHDHIIGFGETLKHGLIPNLLDGGRNPRYNARDATWFYLQAIQEYVKFVPEGLKILGQSVKRRFPKDDTWIPYDDPKAFAYSLTLVEIIYEILSRHAAGISYREHNAGPQIDLQMKDNGFNVSISVDWSNGLIFGGNQDNCGTWMDKMGELERAGSKGVPGTPRDGAAVEINGLLKLTLRFVNELRKKGLFKWDSVTTQDGKKVTFEDWESLVQENFEKCFYIPENAEDDKDYVIDPKLVNRRGIYKDLYRSGKPFEDYQLRPNVAMAMCAAPELFSEDHGRLHLEKADEILRDHVGMATLDPLDWNYEPYYNNLEDSDNFRTAKGRLYHQGPPWCFPLGFHLQAYCRFVLKDPVQLNQRLKWLREWIKTSPWAGITELTNAGGELNKDSLPSQAWSTATLLHLVHLLDQDKGNL